MKRNNYFKFKFGTIKFFLLIALILIVISIFSYKAFQEKTEGNMIVLIVSDDQPNSLSIYQQAWVDSANEEGIPFQIMTATQFTQRSKWKNSNIKGIILPDTIHRKMGDAFVEHIYEYVRQEGGRLMLVYDAGALDLDGAHVEPMSRFSDMLGIKFLEYGRLREKIDQAVTVHAKPAQFEVLHIPPGRYMPDTNNSNALAVITGYKYDVLRYSSLALDGAFSGKTLLQSERGSVIAGVRSYGKGEVLFVNLPLGYLKLRTDGVLLHGLLRYFANDMLGFPVLSAVPEGIGGMTLNWHCDAKVCETAMERLFELDVFKQGPYSFHITAGPDKAKIGDGLGLDLDNNPKMQQFVKKLLADGHAVGSHGGWIHDYFGTNLPKESTQEFLNYLEKNKQSVERLTKAGLAEYSAPQGNQPQWVTDWLSEEGVKAYYITANMGMGPTRTYHDGNRDDLLWSFPVQGYGKIASIEEAFFAQIPQDEIGAWLENMVRFVQQERVSRLIYFHPPGAMLYPNAVKRLFDKTREAQTAGSFRWRTMLDLADFLERRNDVRWKVKDVDNNVSLLEATTNADLKDMTWEFSKARYEKPGVIEGAVAIKEQGAVWQVIASSGNKIKVQAKKR